MRRPTAGGSSRGAKATRLQRLVFEPGSQRAAIRTGALARFGGGRGAGAGGGGAAGEGGEGDEEDEGDFDDPDIHDLAERMGME